MFTGIVEEIGTIKNIKNGEKGASFFIEGNKVLNKAEIGDSISTNGVCLTVTNINNNSFEADVMFETLKRSNLGSLEIGSKVNLERALTLESRLGGHIVSGHIDGIGKISSLVREDNSVCISIKAEQNILKYVIEKGSIAIDGISLTVSYVDNKLFKVCIIPHTMKETTLIEKGVGNTVNLECDIIGKYVEKLLGLNKEEKNNKNISSIDKNFLIDNGFI